jgi:hypothetical protein
MASPKPEAGIASVASQGGIARRDSLTADERSAIARRAVEVRWEKAGKLKAVPEVTHGSPDHPLKIGEIEIPCYVLNDERRVLVQSGVMSALDMSQGTAGRGAGDRLARFLATKSINPFVPQHLRDVIMEPIKFKVGGNIAYGYEATILADLCDAVLDARLKGKLNYQQDHIAARCEILVRSFARVGIIALVDEATGFQYDRARRALEEILKKFLSDELRRWVQTFPPEYFKQLCRLRYVEFRPDMKLPPYFGHLTNDIVYRRLAPGVLKELRERSPRNEKGNRGNKLFQWLSADIGHPKLLQHLGLVVGLMTVSDTYAEFKALLDRAAPIYPENPTLFDDPTDWE